MGSYLDVKPLNIDFYVLGKFYTNFKQNEHVKFTKTHQDKQVLSKAYLPNVMDVLGHMTSKHYQSSHTA